MRRSAASRCRSALANELEAAHVYLGPLALGKGGAFEVQEVARYYKDVLDLALGQTELRTDGAKPFQNAESYLPPDLTVKPKAPHPAAHKPVRPVEQHLA